MPPSVNGSASVNMNISVQEHEFDGTPSVVLSAGQYRAMVLPEMGGNLVALDDVLRGLTFLRTPPDLNAIKEKPVLWGFPVLFPPNRIEGGTFAAGGKAYTFPLTEPARNNHIHGFVKNIPWEVTALGTTEDSAFVELAQTVGPEHPMYQDFPHEFTLSLRYTLSESGLEKLVRVVNNGSTEMPMMIGFHTTLCAPFHPESSEDDYTIKMTIGQRWEMSERMLPTGQFQPLTVNEQKLKECGVNPCFADLDNHYTALPQGGRNYVELTDHRLGIRLVYDAGLKYKQWMLFNNFARGGFICPEPQTCVVNAPNTGLPDSESGFLMLQPGEEWTETSRLYAEDM